MTPERQLILATYGLVIATALVVVATAIPVIQKWMEQRQERLRRASLVVPDINMLHSRFGAAVRDLANKDDADGEKLQRHTSRELQIIASIIDNSYPISLQFANEAYLLRHFITSAENDARVLARIRASENSPHQQDDIRKTLEKICMKYQAAHITLREAEALLPDEARLIDGASFWERFSAHGKEREIQAQKELVDIRSEVDSQATG